MDVNLNFSRDENEWVIPSPSLASDVYLLVERGSLLPFSEHNWARRSVCHSFVPNSAGSHYLFISSAGRRILRPSDHQKAGGPNPFVSESDGNVNKYSGNLNVSHSKFDIVTHWYDRRGTVAHIATPDPLSALSTHRPGRNHNSFFPGTLISGTSPSLHSFRETNESASISLRKGVQILVESSVFDGVALAIFTNQDNNEDGYAVRGYKFLYRIGDMTRNTRLGAWHLLSGSTF
jgi:hypothetical protein